MLLGYINKKLTADIREGADPEPALLYHFIIPAVINNTQATFQLDHTMLVPLIGFVIIIAPGIVFLGYLLKERKYWHSVSAGNPERK